MTVIRLHSLILSFHLNFVLRSSENLNAFGQARYFHYFVVLYFFFQIGGCLNEVEISCALLLILSDSALRYHQQTNHLLNLYSLGGRNTFLLLSKVQPEPNKGVELVGLPFCNL